MPKIHPLAIVDPKAQLADDVEVGPFCTVGPDVKLAAGNRLISHVVIANRTTVGGWETFDLIGIEGGLTPRQDVTLVIHRANGDRQEVSVTLRIDTPIEVDYYLHGGILPYVLRQLIAQVA